MGPYRPEIVKSLNTIFQAELPEDAAFILLDFHPGDLRGLPVLVAPTQTNQLQYTDWIYSEALCSCIPEEISLPDEFTSNPESEDELFLAVGVFFMNVIKAMTIQPKIPPYLSMDGCSYFRLKDGVMVSPRDIALDFQNVK